jgi:hypothetical protein
LPTNLLVCTGSPREIVLERPGTPIFSLIRAQSCTNAKSSRLPDPVGLPASPRAKTVPPVHKNAQTGVCSFAPPFHLSSTLTPTNRGRLSNLGFVRQIPLGFPPRPKTVPPVHKNAQTNARRLSGTGFVPQILVPTAKYQNCCARDAQKCTNRNSPPKTTRIAGRQLLTHSSALSVFIRVHPWPFSFSRGDCRESAAWMDARQPIRFIMPLARSRPSARELGRRLCDV